MQLLKQASQLHIKYILLIALFLRALWALFVPVDPVSDSVVYDLFANSIASGKGYTFPDGSITVFWAVGTSAIYGMLYKVFGLSFVPIIILNITLGVSIVWLTFKIAQRYLSNNTAIISAFLVAIWPILIEFTTILASELIFIFLILSVIYIWGSKNISSVLRAIIWGGLLCAATYVRPTALALIVILPVLDSLSGTKIQDCLVAVCVAILTATILFSPWVNRNYQQFGEFVLVSANGGTNLWMGNNAQSNGGYTPLLNIDFKNEVVRDHYYKKEAINYIHQNPLDYLKLAVKRTIITYKAETIGIVWNGYLDKHLNKHTIILMKLISTIYWWLMLGLSSIGIYQLLKKRKIKPFHVLFIIPAFFFIFPILTVGQDRYHMPIDPFLAIFSAFAIQQFINVCHDKTI